MYTSAKFFLLYFSIILLSILNTKKFRGSQLILGLQSIINWKLWEGHVTKSSSRMLMFLGNEELKMWNTVSKEPWGC